jgi:hypothetical protein
MPQVPFSRVVSLLEASGYRIHHRTKYPQFDDAYFYFFVHADPDHPAIGFPVRSKLVEQRYQERILVTLKRSENDEDDKAKDT